jgi:hypothetical protein
LQHKFICKLATHTGLPSKLIRQSLDKQRLLDEQVLDFQIPDYGNLESFYVTNCKLNINELLNAKKFAKSELQKAYTLYQCIPNTRGVTFVVYSSLFFVLCDFGDFSYFNRGVGGIYLAYTDIENKLLLPLDMYLQLKYPSPS